MDLSAADSGTDERTLVVIRRMPTIAAVALAFGWAAGALTTAGGAPATPPATFAPWSVPDKGVWTVYVRDVHDGDTATVCLMVPVTVRLNGINAPELKAPGGDASRVALTNLVGGRVLQCEFLGHEKYGRTLGRLWPTDPTTGTPVNASDWMIAHGFAVKWDGTGPRP